MPNDDPQNVDGDQQQNGQQQNTGQEAQNQAQNSAGEQNGTPTPKDVQQRAQNDSGVQDAKTVAELPDWAQKIVEDSRKDSGRYRDERNQAKQDADARVAAILKAAGIETDEGTDPEQAAADDRKARETAEADARAARVELAVHRAAPGKNADATALLDSRAFQARVQDLDPTDSDALAAAIDKAVEDNPRLAATQAAARSSADFTGGNGDGAITPEKFRAMGMAERNALYQSDPDTYRRLAAQR